ncbi:hypothetical protein C8R43DRAFT_995376 [Mycena crocata]|nr:hypothetical protein C8R43DRAFT_995376 [Mycena crocata]
MLLSCYIVLSLPLAWAASTSETHQKLVALAAAGAGGLIQLDVASFDLLTAPDRDWSASIEFTALDAGLGCFPCKDLHPSWTAVSRAWTQTPQVHRDNHFFATLDFNDASEIVFQKLGLSSAPAILVYPPTNGPRATGKSRPLGYDLSLGFEPEPLARYLSQHTPTPVPYTPPFDWLRWTTIGARLLILAVVSRFITPIIGSIIPILQSRWTWGVPTILTSLIMTSGYMYTRIRNSPPMGKNGNWIAGGLQNQFGCEVWVVATLYGTLASAFVMLIMLVPYQTSARHQRFQIYFWSSVILLVYSILVVVLRVKHRGYPFRLLL